MIIFAMARISWEQVYDINHQMSQGRVNDINTKRYSYSITVLRNGIFLVASQEIICNSGRQQTKSLTKILDENSLEYLASGEGFILDRLRLEILTRILNKIFNKNEV